MVGSAIMHCLKNLGYENIVTNTHNELDLVNQEQTKSFENERPEVVYVAAAKVGGILANSKYRGQFLYENLSIQNNIIHFAHTIGVDKLIFLGSACVYPRLAEQPIKKEYLLNGLLEPTNDHMRLQK